MLFLLPYVLREDPMESDAYHEDLAGDNVYFLYRVPVS